MVLTLSCATVGAREATPDIAAETAASVSPMDCPDDDIACQEQLYELGEALFLYEAGIEKAIGPAAQNCWREDVAAFQRSINECGDIACRVSAMHARLGSLHDLQSDAARTHMALPEGPVLIAVLGPEDDVSANDSSTPWVREGNLVHAHRHAEHMGIAVRQGDHDHVVVYDMDLGDQPGHNDLMGLVGTSPTARVRVTGFRHDTPNGVPNFDTGRCRLVHQLP